MPSKKPNRKPNQKPGKTLRIVSRRSPLALCQAGQAREALLARHPDCAVEIIGVKTAADRFLHRPLSGFGGKGVFVKELEQALLDGAADAAVHSMKDVPAALPPRLALPVIMRRETAADVLVCNRFASITDLPPGARVGTSSLRRSCQLLARRADLRVTDMRGNVGTRLAKLDRGEVDALILAAAGLRRLGLQERIRETIAADVLLPAAGQGALGVEIRADDAATLEMVSALAHQDTALCVAAERAVTRRLGGDCRLPLAAYAVCEGEQMTVRALVGKPDGSALLRDQAQGEKSQARRLGERLGDALLAQGAAAILRECQAHAPEHI